MSGSRLWSNQSRRDLMVSQTHACLCWLCTHLCLHAGFCWKASAVSHRGWRSGCIGAGGQSMFFLILWSGRKKGVIILEKALFKIKSKQLRASYRERLTPIPPCSVLLWWPIQRQLSFFCVCTNLYTHTYTQLFYIKCIAYITHFFP